MNITRYDIPGLVLLEPKVWNDDRGFFLETYHAKKYAEAGLVRPFLQDNHSQSKRGVLRGLHSQVKVPQGKLIYVVRGEIWDVAVDIRRGSPTFGQWMGVTLSAENHRQLFVPEGCLHGFVVMSDVADVTYKCTELYQPGDEQGVLWNDPGFKIDWPVAQPILSSKDAVLPRFADLSDDRIPVFRG